MILFLITTLILFLIQPNNASEKRITEAKNQPTTEYLYSLNSPITPLNYSVRAVHDSEISQNPAIRQDLAPTSDIMAIKDYIHQLWGKNAEMMILIISCESNFNSDAYNPEIRAKELGITKYGSYGLAQINALRDEKLFEWKYNLDMAFLKYQNNGFYPWLNCAKKLNLLN